MGALASSAIGLYTHQVSTFTPTHVAGAVLHKLQILQMAFGVAVWLSQHHPLCQQHTFNSGTCSFSMHSGARLRSATGAMDPFAVPAECSCDPPSATGVVGSSAVRAKCSCDLPVSADCVPECGDASEISGCSCACSSKWSSLCSGDSFVRACLGSSPSSSRCLALPCLPCASSASPSPALALLPASCCDTSRSDGATSPSSLVAARRAAVAASGASTSRPDTPAEGSSVTLLGASIEAASGWMAGA